MTTRSEAIEAALKLIAENTSSLWARDVARAALALPVEPQAAAEPRTLLQQYDREQQPGYHDGREDGRKAGYEVGLRHGAERVSGLPLAAPSEPVQIEFAVRLSAFGIAMYHGQSEKARVLAEVLTAQFAESAQPDHAAAMAREGWVMVPIEPTEAMRKAGGHANSEWLNDNAPLGEARYAMPMVSVWEAMIAAAPQPGETK